MNKTLFKNSVKQIYKTRRRFLSILVMAFLGVGVFSGLVATSPDMQESLDQYLDETILYDISVISTLDPQQQMNNIPNSKWYIGDRSDNTGYENITDAINSIANLSKMFPVVFYVIAVLISLTSMTRMVEEERIEIGTLKALGYHNAQIMFKYLLYALAACILGGVIGMSVGFYVIPNIIWNIYSIIYKIPNFQALYHLNIGVLGLFIAFLCIGGATFFVAYKTLEQMPSVLMRPKAAKNGKRILLERVSWLWNKLSFTEIYTYETSVYLDHNRDDIKALLLEEDNIMVPPFGRA